MNDFFENLLSKVNDIEEIDELHIKGGFVSMGNSRPMGIDSGGNGNCNCDCNCGCGNGTCDCDCGCEEIDPGEVPIV